MALTLVFHDKGKHLGMRYCPVYIAEDVKSPLTLLCSLCLVAVETSLWITTWLYAGVSRVASGNDEPQAG
jgi:hypothetical protein